VKSTQSVILLENLVCQENKICRLKDRINWNYLDHELGHLFKSEHAPSSRLIFGLLYLQSISNLHYLDMFSIWKDSPEWQYFCGEKYLNETYPLLDAPLSFWSHVIGEQGHLSMVRALGAWPPKETLH